MSASIVSRLLAHRSEVLLTGVSLRPYQSRAVDLVLAAFASGHDRALLHAPTGAGKTVMFAALAAMFHAAGLPVLVVAHRRELLSQAAERLRGAGVANPVVYRGARHAAALAVVDDPAVALALLFLCLGLVGRGAR